ncbi:MAG: Ig-like domain-containing protein [Gemmatimonadaceae bacterium]|nr:Ig-like domain-containing protein [Gemmatimonadaceae bacterium]
MRRTLIAALLGGAALAACASPGQPPGGPTDLVFPKVVATLPESNAVNARPNRVLIRFDDVISEQVQGGDLSRQVLVSPWDGGVDVAWRRTGLAIRPSKGWRPNTPYTVTVLPGIADLRGNQNKDGYTLRFSTGPDLPATAVRGVTFDWAAGKPLARALVQVLDRRDTTLAYITASDSTGRFELRMIPAGDYVVRAIDEKGTPNRALEPREPWDSVGIRLADSARAELYLVVRDTFPPRLGTPERRDSVTIVLPLDRPIDPTLRIDTSLVRIVAADSSVVRVTALLTSLQDSLRLAREDSIRVAGDTALQRAQRRTLDPTLRRDTTSRAPLPVLSRPPLSSGLVARLAVPLAAGTNYRITLTGVRGIMGRAAPVSRTLVIPKAAPPDSTGARAPGDTSRVPPRAAPGTSPATVPRDTTRRPPASPPRSPRPEMHSR